MRWRLISAFMVVTLLVVLVQDIPLGNYLVRVERDRLTTSLERDAFLLGGRTRQILEARRRTARRRGRRRPRLRPRQRGQGGDR